MLQGTCYTSLLKGAKGSAETMFSPNNCKTMRDNFVQHHYKTLNIFQKFPHMRKGSLVFISSTMKHKIIKPVADVINLVIVFLSLDC